MVIQSNMPVAGIVSAWPETEKIFTQHGINIHDNKALEQLVAVEALDNLIKDLNRAINSSEATCIGGG